jgi:hypothetical protein
VIEKKLNINKNMDIDREHYSDNDDSPMVSVNFIIYVTSYIEGSSVISLKMVNNSSLVPQKNEMWKCVSMERDEREREEIFF